MERKSVDQIVLALIAAFLLGWTACGDSGTDRIVQSAESESSCVDCHLDQVALKLLAVEEELPEDTGEG